MISVFARRPILASVLAVVITLVGVIAALQLPVARYPKIAPPQVRVSAAFTGGSANTVAEAVSTPIEQAINGVDGLIYIESSSGNDGSSTVSATFEVGYDVDVAAVDVLTAVNQARPRLPQTVRDAGVTIDKASPQLTAVISLFAEDERFDALFLSNFATINIVDPIARIPGVGRTVNFTRRDYAIRVWLDPERMRYLNLSTDEVVAAINAQNVSVAAGTIGQEPAPPGQAFELQVNTLGRLENEEQFADIILRTRPDGSVLRLRDVGYIELGAESYGSSAQFSGRPSAQIGIFQSPDANALQLLGQIQDTMAEIEGRFPEGLAYDIAFDTSRFVETSIREVIVTLVQAIGLVVLVVFVFLQKGRTTLIPCIVIPVSLIGSFALMYLAGFSINQLTLLGLILAVGLVVDDAIVVVENVERNLQPGKDPSEATILAVREVIGPIVATTAVLFALFVPVAFIPGISGLLYNQFALTVAFAVGLSSVASLTLTPALCAALLRPDQGQRAWPFRKFNQGFKAASNRYRGAVGGLLRVWPLVVVAMAGLIALTVFLFVQRPTGFVPQEDQGYFIANIQLPAGASVQRTEEVVFEVERRVLATEGVANSVAIAGSSFVGNTNASYFGFVIGILAPWGERNLAANNAAAIVERLSAEFRQIADAQVQVFNAPPIPGIGSTGGVRLIVEARENMPIDQFAQGLNRFIGAANQNPAVAAAFTTFSADVPQLFAEIDRAKVEQFGVDLSSLFTTLQTYLGSFFVNEFNRFGRTYRVYVQAQDDARDQEIDIGRLSVKNRDGRMVPLDALLTVRPTTGPESISHYNLYTAAQVNAQPMPGVSSGQLITALEQVAAESLPPGFGYEWTGVVYQQQQAGNWAPIIFATAVLFVFLILAAQFESLAVPFIVVLAVPTALLGAIGALALTGTDLDVFGQIGLLMLIGLSAKNSILIVQFANRLRDDGKELVEAALEAARLRLRPILMTAFSFVLGCVPLILASGAGANARQSLGIVVVGGMAVATVLSLLIVPVFYVLVERLRGAHKGESAEAETSEASDSGNARPEQV